MLSRAREQTRYTPDDAKAWHNLGVALLDRGQLKEAKKAFRKAVDIDPSLKASWSSLYLILMLLRVSQLLLETKEQEKVNPLTFLKSS